MTEENQFTITENADGTITFSNLPEGYKVGWNSLYRPAPDEDELWLMRPDGSAIDVSWYGYGDDPDQGYIIAIYYIRSNDNGETTQEWVYEELDTKSLDLVLEKVKEIILRSQDEDRQSLSGKLDRYFGPEGYWHRGQDGLEHLPSPW